MGFERLPAGSVATAVARLRPAAVMRLASFDGTRSLRLRRAAFELTLPIFTKRAQCLPTAPLPGFTQRLPLRTPLARRSIVTFARAGSEMRSEKT